MKILLPVKRSRLIRTVPPSLRLGKTFQTRRSSGISQSAGADPAPGIAVLRKKAGANGRGWLRSRGSYDYCLDLTRSDRSALLTFLSRAKNKITYERTKTPSKWRPLLYNQFIDSSVRYSHTVDHHLAFLAPLGIRNASGAIKLNLPPEAVHDAENILRHAKVQSPFVIFHPGSARREKFWEARRWAEVMDICHPPSHDLCPHCGNRSMNRTPCRD